MKREPRAAPGSGERLLEVAGVRAGYAGTSVLAGVSLHVDRGEIVAVVGANGAGKTTLIRTLAGMLRASAGTVRFDGVEIAGLSSNAVCEAGLAQVPEGRQLFPTLSVEDNLRLGAFQRVRHGERGADGDLGDVYQRFPRLAERRTQLAATLSGGERQMLALGRALMGKPRLLMLDEPSLGLAPRIVREIMHIVADLRKTGVSILLVEQNARAALQVADYGYVLETGEIALEGASSSLAGNPRVVESYLGFASRP